VTFAVGTLIVLALGAAWLEVERDEAADGTRDQGAECVPQTRAKARAAQREFMAEHIEPEPDAAARWYSGSDVTQPDAVNELIAGNKEAGLPAPEPLPDSTPEGWLLLVLYNVGRDRPSLPACLNDTPVLYVGSSGPFAPD
jgi:IS5 family transposase